MSFEDKKIKVSSFRVDGGWGAEDEHNALENIKNNIASTLDSVGGEANIGWASGRSELNLNLSEEECHVGECLYLSMRIAVRKVPAAMAKALLRKKSEDYMKDNGVDHISSKIKKELKEEVQDYLLPRSMPTVKTVWVIICPGGLVYAGTVSRIERDSLCILFLKTFGKPLIEQDFSLVFSEQENKTGMTVEFPEFEFLTDLFRQSDSGEVDNFFVHAPYDFISPDNESPCTRSLAVGIGSVASEEVRTALNQKKLLKKAKIGVSGIPPYEDRDCWSFVLNKDGSVSGLTTLEGEEMEFSARFAEKVSMLNALFGWIHDKMKDFISRAESPDYEEKRAKWLDER